MYTQGRGHRDPCVRLRDNEYTPLYDYRRREKVPGFGLEDVLVENGADLYIAGHEHVFQHHSARGLHHIICGNSGADIRSGHGFYGGADSKPVVDWFDKTNSYGFVDIVVRAQQITVSFVNARGQPFRVFTITK